MAFSFAAADLLLELDDQGKICFASGAAKGILGKDLPDLDGMAFADLLDPQDRRVITYLLENMKEGERISPVSARMQNTNTMAVIGACSLPRVNGHIYLTLNVTGLPAAQSVAVHRDTETGLLTNNDFVQLATDQLNIAAETGQELELTLLELSNLGDMSKHTSESDMEEFFNKMGAVLRSYSLGGDSAGRLDGDKYGVLHNKSLDHTVLQEKVETLSNEVAPGHGLKTDASTIDLEKGKLSQENATHALMFVINSFVNDTGGGFSMSSLAEGLQGRMETTLNRISSLKNVFKRHQFSLVYQPIVNLLDETTHHYEVLCRFKDGESPYETVTFAEEVGIIRDLDLAVTKKTLEALSEYPRQGRLVPHVAVNISGHSLESDDFVDTLYTLLGDYPNFRKYLSLEVTESSQIRDLVRANRVIQQFRKNGIEVSLDDLGAGAASFQYIQALDVDNIKIDGAYVRDVLHEEKDAAILKCMARLCRDLKIGTIAEMVETRDQFQLLKRMGVDYGQGWFFGKPQAVLDMPFKKRQISLNMKRKGVQSEWN
ncbi:sensor domain-containing phosphodiesterase [Sneathiella chinensis]|uniref:sensor domain-containing phosphodiesterase n=1 Tax=Sneathiella chinensis TaxID=349750 RepID=UPI00146C6561|nr:EAL domain-containing protein [Sneathiella chinensis]